MLPAEIEAAITSAVAQRELTEVAGKNLRHWLNSSTDHQHRQAVLQLIRQRQFDELMRLFWEQIPFGTGGRRGPMSDFGTATINRQTISESAWGLAQVVLQYHPTNSSVVIACDTRHRSVEFAELCAEVIAAQGIYVRLFREPRATPELSFAVRHLQCSAGIMISASHNPPSDNGFKAYWSNGGQVLPPYDQAIIDAVARAVDIPRIPLNEAIKRGLVAWIEKDVDEAYLSAVAALLPNPAQAGVGPVRRRLHGLFTPLHGVGESSVFQLLRRLGFDGIQLFQPQANQDGSFPNVPDHLPNPERPAVFQAAIAAATDEIDLILATDPDADRVAAAVRTGSGKYTSLTGNQAGALIADYLLSTKRDQGELSPDSYLVRTLVTTPLLDEIASCYGVQVEANLPVGFKHIGAAIDRLGAEKFVFGAEESLGYLAGDYCRDKDACIGAMFLAQLAAELKSSGLTLVDRLHQLFERHGVHREDQYSLEAEGANGVSVIQHLMTTLRTSPPLQMGDVRLQLRHDYKSGESADLSDLSQVTPLQGPKTDLLVFEGTLGSFAIRFAARPSGTEPKIKFYLFLRELQPLRSDAIERRLAEATTVLDSVKRALAAWVQATRGSAT